MKSILLLSAFVFLMLPTYTFADVNLGDVITKDINLVQIQIDGSKINESIFSHKQGQKVILDFFSINCSHCLKNLPALNQVANEMSTYAVTRLIDIDRNTDAVEKFVAANRQTISFPVALDNTREATKFFGITGTPTLYVVDENNNVIYMHVGSMEDVDWTQLKESLKK